MAKKIKKSQVIRHLVQLILFIALPGLYAMTFNEVGIIYRMIIGGNFDFIQALPNLMEFSAVMLITMLMGRWFCGWICTFGAYNDFIYFLSKKIFNVKFKVNEKVDSILKYVKYIILIFIVIVSWTLGSNILDGTSPWDVFGQMNNMNNVFSSLIIGLIFLVLITIGAAFIERFFCRYLCPLGAIFSIISKIGITKINKPKNDCGMCRACTMNCSMGLKLYKVDKAKGGDCINCLKCTEVCPRKNANINIIGQNLNQNLAGSAAMAAMIGIYGITNFGVDALTKAGIITNNNVISAEVMQEAASNSASKKYEDGTYTGSGHGFGGTTKVSVTIKDGKITDIKTLSNQDTADYYNRAFGAISKGIISIQAPNVDTVSGATYSSKGIISAVKDALSQAAVSGSDSDISANDTSEVQNENAASNSPESEKTAVTNSLSNVKDVAFDDSQKTYKDGTYTGSGQGFGGTTNVSVTISNGKITNIQTLSNEDTAEYYQKASNGIMGRIISAQSPNVDTVSGATYSSRGIINAVKNALNKAAALSSGGSNSNSGTSSSSANGENASSKLNSDNISKSAPPVSQKTTASQPAAVQKNTDSGAAGSQGSTNNSSKGTYKDGTYTGSGSGFGGTTKISVTIVNGKITNISTISEEDTSKYYNRAIGTIKNSIISKQSASVDAVSGATYSSKGIMSAVADALSQAK